MGFDVKQPNWSMTTIDLYTTLRENETIMRLELDYVDFVKNIPLLGDSPHLRNAVYDMLTQKIGYEWMRRKNYQPEEGTLVSDEKVWENVRIHHMHSLQRLPQIQSMAVEIHLTDEQGKRYLEFHLTVLEAAGCHMSSSRRMNVPEYTDIAV